MRINPEKCSGCKECIPYCSVEAIIEEKGKCIIDEDKCFECYACLKAEVCPTNALEKTPLEWPRKLRYIFSCPTSKHEKTGLGGRGCEGGNTNDVTKRYGLGEVGFVLDVGRPGLGTTFADIEKLTIAVAKIGVDFCDYNPITLLMTDKKSGKLRDDIKKERILSCELEFKAEESKFISIINALKEVAKHIDTVFCVGCIGRVSPDGSIRVKEILDREGMYYRPNVKINVGLGRP